MQYARLGTTGLVVSRVAFGAMTFTAGNRELATVYKVSGDLADELVGAAVDAGVNFFDTADLYANGESETLLGSALTGKRDQVVIATKVGFRAAAPVLQSGLSRRHILWSVDQSLRRLQTDWIDIYIAHREDPFTPLEETLDALDTVVRTGKVRYLGFSNWSAWKAAAALELQKSNGLAPFTHGQMHYSLLARDVERDVVPMMGRYGLGLTVWSPLASGFLTGKYSPHNLSDPSNRYAGFDIFPFDKGQGFALVDRMRRIGVARQATVAQVAIAWLLSREKVTSILLGATKRSQLDDNLKAVDLHLSIEDLAELDAATTLSPVYPNWAMDMALDRTVADADGSDQFTALYSDSRGVSRIYHMQLAVADATAVPVALRGVQGRAPAAANGQTGRTRDRSRGLPAHGAVSRWRAVSHLPETRNTRVHGSRQPRHLPMRTRFRTCVAKGQP
jgi:aryl-alcohol dehydrogenase-like predicted oxidoreductase